MPPNLRTLCDCHFVELTDDVDLDLRTFFTLGESTIAGDIFRRLPRLTVLDLGTKTNSYASPGQTKPKNEARCYVAVTHRDLRNATWRIATPTRPERVKFFEPKSELVDVAGGEDHFMRIGYSLSDY